MYSWIRLTWTSKRNDGWSALNRSDADVNGKVHALNAENRECLRAFRRQYRRGVHPAVEVAFDPHIGLVTQASDAIPNNTLLAEYAGDVVSLATVADQGLDCLFELIANHPPDASEQVMAERTLVINSMSKSHGMTGSSSKTSRPMRF